MENSLKPVASEKNIIESSNSKNTEKTSSNAVNDDTDRPETVHYAKATPEQSDSTSTQLESASKLTESCKTITVNINDDDANKTLENSCKISSISEQKVAVNDPNHVLFDEDVDVRNHYFKSEVSRHDVSANLLKSTSTAPNLGKPEHELHSTPKSHFTAVVNIKLSSPPKAKTFSKNPQSSVSLVSGQKSVEDLMQREDAISAAVDEASKNLVERVLAEVSESAKEEFQLQTENEQLLFKARSENDTAGTKLLTDQNSISDKDYTDDTITELTQNTPENFPSTSNTPQTQTNICTNEQEFKPNNSTKEPSEKCNKQMTTKSEETKPERPASMPPAFAEFIANLTKKKPLTHSTNSYVASGSLRSSGSDRISRSKIQRAFQPTRRSVPEINGGERSLYGMKLICLFFNYC